MRVKSDGRVELRTSSNAAEFFVGEDSTGTVLQTGGTVTSDNTVRIGSEAGRQRQVHDQRRPARHGKRWQRNIYNRAQRRDWHASR